MPPGCAWTDGGGHLLGVGLGEVEGDPGLAPAQARSASRRSLGRAPVARRGSRAPAPARAALADRLQVEESLADRDPVAGCEEPAGHVHAELRLAQQRSGGRGVSGCSWL